MVKVVDCQICATLNQSVQFEIQKNPLENIGSQYFRNIGDIHSLRNNLKMGTLHDLLPVSSDFHMRNLWIFRPCLVLKKWSLITHHSVFITHHSSLITHHSLLKIPQFPTPPVWHIFSVSHHPIFSIFYGTHT